MRIFAVIAAFVFLFGCTTKESIDCNPISDFKISPDDSYIAHEYGDNLCIHGMNGLYKTSIPVHKGFAWINSSHIALGQECDSYCIEIWDIEKMEKTKTIEIEKENVTYSRITYLNGSLVVDYETNEGRVKIVKDDEIMKGPEFELLDEDIVLIKDVGIHTTPYATKQGEKIAKYDSGQIIIYSLDGTNLTKIKEIDFDIEEIVERRLGYGLRKIEYSPDGRYIAAAGTYSITAGPSIPHVSGLGFVIVLDTENESIVLFDKGGSTIGDNFGFFGWRSDNRLLYGFQGEGLHQLRTFDPATEAK